jgi:hypothetical protein
MWSEIWHDGLAIVLAAPLADLASYFYSCNDRNLPEMQNVLLCSWCSTPHPPHPLTRRISKYFEIPRSTQDPPKIHPRSTKIHPKSTQDPPKIHTRSTQDPPKIHPRSSQDPPRSTTKIHSRSTKIHHHPPKSQPRSIQSHKDPPLDSPMRNLRNKRNGLVRPGGDVNVLQSFWKVGVTKGVGHRSAETRVHQTRGGPCTKCICFDPSPYNIRSGQAQAAQEVHKAPQAALQAAPQAAPLMLLRMRT